jgi:hypothetical protein
MPHAIRVGVTGHRLNKLDAHLLPELRARVRDALGLISAAARDCAEHVQCVPHLRVLSPLAEGADRMVAEAALELEYSLEAPLPFSQPEYERDFPETVHEFRKLIRRASTVVELGGDRSEENRSYEAVGRFVVEHCDVLIALWDGQQAAGRGGTAEIVRFAASANKPVWWIHVKNPATPTLISNLREFLHLGHAPSGHHAIDALARHLKRGGTTRKPREAARR